MPPTRSRNLRAENERLRSEIETLGLRLEEAEQALEANRTRQTDSLVADGPNRSEELVAAEWLARSVLEQAADAIVVCDGTGRIIRASKSAAELCGANLLLTPFEQAFPLVASPAGVHGAPSLLSEAMGGESVRAVPATLVRRDEARAELLVSANALHASDGRTVGCVVTLVDVTEQRRQEEALREADRRKNEFLAALSHELRNPLAPIKNGLFILDHAPAGSEQARHARAIIERQTDQLVRLVDDLLDVTRITRNKIQLRRERLELNELVRGAMEDHRSEFDESGVRLELTPAPMPIYVNADSNRLAQVVGNLLQNAAKFTDRNGKARVTVATSADARRAVISVADTGVGLAPEMFPRIFEPFSQAEDALDRSKGGLGLGLALTKGLVELHGGDISVHSEGLGKGAEFVIRLPLGLPDLAGPLLVRPSVQRRRRILVIEDNVDAADTLSDALELGDHETAVAYDGPSGLEKAREFRPDVVLCDIGLPQMSGYEVARAFRADEGLRGAFLVAISGYAMPDDLQRAWEAGFDTHLAKPPRLEQLEELLSSLPDASERRSRDWSRVGAPEAH